MKKLLQVQTIIILFLLLLNCGGSIILTSHPLYKPGSNSQVIIIRPTMKLGSMVATPILLNSTLIAKMKIGTYCIIPISSGEYTLQFGQGDPITTLMLPTTIDISIKDNDKVFVLLNEGSKNDPKYGDCLALLPKILTSDEGNSEITKWNKIEPVK